MQRAGQPALVVDRALAEHRVELRPPARNAGVGETGGEALALDRALLVALDHVGRLDPEQLVDRRNDVDRVHVLLARLGLRLDPAGQEIRHMSEMPPS